MSSRALYRLAAVALITSGAALAAGLILHPMPPFAASIATAQWTLSHVFWWAGALTGIVGLTGAYLRRREELGVLGFVGIGLVVVGLALLAGALYFEALIAPSLAARAPALFESFPLAGGWEGFLAGVLASGALFGVGLVLLGIALFRAGTTPRWAIVLALLGGPPFAVNFLLPRPVAVAAVAVFGIGLLGIGRALWQSAGRPDARPMPDRAARTTSGAHAS